MQVAEDWNDIFSSGFVTFPELVEYKFRVWKWLVHQFKAADLNKVNIYLSNHK